MIESSFPRLEDRARGWLRFAWDKATTEDDWSSAGEPLPWWDRLSTPPLCSIIRLDLDSTACVLPVMSDITPAWRETYTRMIDELVGRYTTFWAAIDWITQIGHDPNRDRYPPEWFAYMAESLRGQYDAPGWCANGIEPWGLQPDPIGADGILTHRGFFNLLLCFYEYIAGDGKWLKPFQVTGYQDRLFEWDHHRMVRFMHDQWAERPAGVHCENTKVWPFCVSGASLGLQMYDSVFGASTHYLFAQWIEYARRHYMKLDRRGALEWFAFCYDPLNQTLYRLRDDVSAYAALCTTPYVLPQDKEFATLLYESSVRTLGWDDPSRPLLQLHPDPRFAGIALLLARELGDATTEERLRSLAEREFEPRFFGDDDDRFGWWFNTGEEWPRGQLANLMMLSELGQPGDWSRVFTQSNLTKFEEPTVESVDYPDLGIAQAWNDHETGALWVETYVATTTAKGRSTSWRVTQLPNPDAVTIECDGSTFTSWRVPAPETIEVNVDVADHLFRISTGYHGGMQPLLRNQVAESRPAPDKRLYLPAAPTGGSCCAG